MGARAEKGARASAQAQPPEAGLTNTRQMPCGAAEVGTQMPTAHCGPCCGGEGDTAQGPLPRRGDNGTGVWVSNGSSGDGLKVPSRQGQSRAVPVAGLGLSGRGATRPALSGPLTECPQNMAHAGTASSSSARTGAHGLRTRPQPVCQAPWTETSPTHTLLTRVTRVYDVLKGNGVRSRVSPSPGS